MSKEVFLVLHYDQAAPAREYSDSQNNVGVSAAGQFRLGRQELANKSA
jgi:hypothetical protein